jgi:hypothetical protein
MMRILPYLFALLSLAFFGFALIMKGGSGFSPPRLQAQEVSTAKWLFCIGVVFTIAFGLALFG